MAQRNALRGAGRAGREHQQRRVAGTRNVEVRRRPVGQIDPNPGGGHPAEPSGIVQDRQGRVGGGRHRADLGGPEGGVDRDHDQSEAQGRHVGDGQVDGRRGADQQPVAGSQPGHRVPAGDGCGPLLELGSAQPAPVGTGEGRGARRARPAGRPGAGQRAGGDQVGCDAREAVLPPGVGGGHHQTGGHGAASVPVLVAVVLRCVGVVHLGVGGAAREDGIAGAPIEHRRPAALGGEAGPELAGGGIVDRGITVVAPDDHAVVVARPPTG